MADDEKKKDESKEKKAGGGPLDNKIILLAAIIVAQALVAFGVTQFVIAPKLQALATPETEEVAEVDQDKDKPEQGVLVGLNEVVVTLRDSGPTSSYLRINIDLEVVDGKVATLVEQRLPHLRDIVILSLSNKFASDLRSMDGKSALKAELFRKLGDTLPEDSLMNIYFSDMVVQ